MDLVDILLNRIEGEEPVNVLVCFSKKKTEKALKTFVNKAIRFTESSSITLLNLVNARQAAQIREKENDQSNPFSETVELNETGKVAVRTFVKESEDGIDEILCYAEKYDCNLVLQGIDSRVLNPSIWGKLLKTSNRNATKEIPYAHESFNRAPRSMLNLSALLTRNKVSTGIFIDNNFSGVQNVFVVILTQEDAFAFPYFYQLAKHSDVSITVWDAIGLMKSDQKMQRLFQFIGRKAGREVKLWNNNKKINAEFIRQQDLIITGIEGWEKLISSSLDWIRDLPSAFIIKDKETPL